jgi:hypothetical protein
VVVIKKRFNFKLGLITVFMLSLVGVMYFTAQAGMYQINNIVLWSIHAVSAVYMLSYMYLGFKTPYRTKGVFSKKDNKDFTLGSVLFKTVPKLLIYGSLMFFSFQYRALGLIEMVMTTYLFTSFMKQNEDVFFKKYKYLNIVKEYYNKHSYDNPLNNKKMKNKLHFKLNSINNEVINKDSYLTNNAYFFNKLQPTKDEVISNDVLMVNAYGVFVIKTLKTSGELYSKKGMFSGDWVQTIPEKNIVRDLENPFKTNYTAIRNLKEILNKGLFGKALSKLPKNFPIYSLVIANNDLQFNIDRYEDQWVKVNGALLHLNQVEDYFKTIVSEAEGKLKKEQVEKIKESIEEEKLNGLLQIQEVIHKNKEKKNKYIELAS